MIVPLKKIELFALKDDQKQIMRAIQKSSLVMVVKPEGENQDVALSQKTGMDDDKLNKAEKALKFASKYRKTKPFFEDATKITYEQLIEGEEQQTVLEKSANDISEKIEEATKTIETLNQLIVSLEPWEGLDIPLSELSETQYVGIKTGFIDIERIPELEKAPISVKTFGNTANGTAVVAFYHKDEADDAVGALKENGFIESAPPLLSMTVSKEQQRILREIEQQQKLIEQLEQQAVEVAEDIGKLEINRDRAAAIKAVEDAPIGHTEDTFYIEGWIAANKLPKLEQALSSVSDCYELASRDPLASEKPPTITKNNPFTTQFEAITNMLSLPLYGGTDPNPMMAPWYWLIFGMMMADVGYGFLMAVLVGALKFIKKPKGDFGKLVNMMLLCSISTIICGVLFGSYFGETWFPAVIFAPIDFIIQMLIICLVLGVIHLFCAMGMRMREDFKAGKPQDAIYDQLSWMLLITGLGFLFIPQLSTVGIILAAIGGGIILLFAGRASKNVIARLGGGLYGLYSITSYVSDILSYSRILALMLSSGIVGMVMNILAGMVRGEDPNILTILASVLVYIVGHAFNLAMSLLSAYVHASRLQYIEFYGKFYEGGGHAFKPLSPNEKHVELETAKK